MSESNQKEKEWEIIQACRDDRPKVLKWESYWDLPPASISFPIKGSAGKTGNWRTFRPVVNHEDCIQCYFCYMYCPEGVISINEDTKQVEIDYIYCKGCGVCANNCPKKCIEMKKESN
jgi:pyruvate ferredoxin oxidoreductase delta subunit